LIYQFSDNIQRAIIYLSKSNRDWYSQISNLVKAEYFEYPTHSTIYTIIKEYYEKYKELPTDDVIEEEYKKVKTPNQDMGIFTDEIYAINTLDTSALKHDEYYLDLIVEFAKKEAFKMAFAEGLVLIKEGKFGEVERKFRDALTISRSVNNGVEYFKDIDDRWERTYNQDNKERFKSPLKTLNAALDGGIERKEMAMVVAPLGVGKSIWLANQAVVSIMENLNVLYISLEMSEDRVAQRIDSMMTLLPSSSLRNNKGEFDNRLKIFRREFPKGSLIIKQFITGKSNVNTIRSLLTQLKNYADFTPDVLIVDYLELLRPLDDGMKTYEAQEMVGQELRGIGVEYNLGVWTATQANRAGRQADIITDAEIADSYGKLRPADLAISLNQTQEEYDAGRIRTYVIKARNSKGRFIIPTAIDYNTLRMTEGLPMEIRNE